MVCVVAPHRIEPAADQLRGWGGLQSDGRQPPVWGGQYPASPVERRDRLVSSAWSIWFDRFEQFSALLRASPHRRYGPRPLRVARSHPPRCCARSAVRSHCTPLHEPPVHDLQHPACTLHALSQPIAQHTHLTIAPRFARPPACSSALRTCEIAALHTIPTVGVYLRTS